MRSRSLLPLHAVPGRALLAATLAFVPAFAILPARASAAGSSGPYEFVTVGAPDERAEREGAAPEGKPAARVIDPRGLVRRPRAPLGQGYVAEVEPNGTVATAQVLAGNPLVVLGNVYPNADLDYYTFTAAAGDRLYAAVTTLFSANASTDSQLELFAADGTTSIEFDDDDGSLGGLSSTIAGRTLVAGGTYFLRVKHFSATNQLRPYDLYFRLQSGAGAPTPETEPNDTPATANPLPAGGWVSGARNPAVATEQDWFSFTAAAGDTVFLSLDLDPERDAVQWNGRLGIALFGDASNQILVVDDASTGSAANPLSEALVMTIKTAGTYYAFVDSATAATGGPTATYTLSVTIRPAADEGVNCTTYTSTNVPQTIGPGAGLVSSTITVPGNPRIADLDVEIQLNHALMGDIDAHLRSPEGNDNGLFTDIGAAAVGGQTQMDVIFDDEAALTPAFTVLRPLVIKPELAYRLSWFDGENAGGTWTLDLRDDGANASGGTLTGWSLRICEQPPPPPCPPGTGPIVVYTSDFELSDRGFTHSGTQDEWARGLPTAAPITTCSSGVNCWKTDLAGTYNASSNQDLLSPAIDLTGIVGPVQASWSQRYQMENATFDHAFVDAQLVGGTNATRLWEWLDATMTNTVGNPTVTIQESSGWSRRVADVSSYAGQSTFQMRFHVDSDTTVQLGGLAIDDVSVIGCRVLSADLSITKTDGVTTATPGGSTTYTITASNAGPDGVIGATVADTFPASLTCNWTCVGAGGGTCTAAGAGNINDTVNLPSGASVTYTATCAISASATGTLVNTATVSSSAGDPVPGNNSATDTDTLVPSADAAITKTDGVTTATPGGSVTYTITASNAGPSNTTATVADTFPASLTCTWTCVGAGGGTCTAAGSGNINDSVTLPAGGSVTYTASCTISASATGTLSNTATVTGVAADPNPANNSATDTDTLVPSADLAITKSDGLSTATPGTTTTYTIVASNPGPSNTTATVTDTFPAVLFCTWTCVGAGGGTCPANGIGNINAAVTLPAGGSVTFTANCAIDAGATGTLSNTASVSGAAGDPNTANNSATDIDTLTPLADLALSKTDDIDPIGVHRDLTYTLTVSNAGPSNAAGVALTDTLPAGVSFVSSTPGSPTCTHSSGTVTCNLGALAASASTSATIVVSTEATGSQVNNASVSASTSDPTAGNNSASATTTVVFRKGDLDNDLKTDLFLLYQPTNENWVWFMDGITRTSGVAVNPSTPASPTQRVVGVDDFNNDQRNDLVFWDSVTGAVEFWLMNGVNRQGPPVPISGAPTLAPNWKLSATGDFNADGKPDIVWRNVISQKIVLWVMNGTVKINNIIPSPDQAVHANWEIVAALDLNADGNRDFLWYNSTSGKIVRWLMDASVVRITGDFTNPPNAGNNNWKVLAGGDYGVGPGGFPNTNDVVWRNDTSGNFVVWYLDTAGNRTFGTFTVPSGPPNTPPAFGPAEQATDQPDAPIDWIIVGPR